uniref:Uncharacterized protein n=1 Tax=Mycena chlorophos TaxID=658473 RepID=A0ABQ0L6P6_MYCCL|nr:predicted protein [Mycena chlorophos]
MGMRTRKWKEDRRSTTSVLGQQCRSALLAPHPAPPRHPPPHRSRGRIMRVRDDFERIFLTGGGGATMETGAGMETRRRYGIDPVVLEVAVGLQLLRVVIVKHLTRSINGITLLILIPHHPLNALALCPPTPAASIEGSTLLPGGGRNGASSVSIWLALLPVDVQVVDFEYFVATESEWTCVCQLIASA